MPLPRFTEEWLAALGKNSVWYVYFNLKPIDELWKWTCANFWFQKMQQENFLQKVLTGVLSFIEL